MFSSDGLYRYKLTLENSHLKTGKVLCVIMQNPSIASCQIADKSVQFLEKLVFLKKESPFENIRIMEIVNQFALVQTKNFVGTNNAIGKKNDSIIKETIKNADLVVIAWGKTNSYQSRKNFIHGLLSHYGKKHVYRTRKHPSRGSYNNFIVPYTF